MRAVLIVNPNATSTTAAGRDLLAHALESRVRLTVAHTDHRGHAIEIARAAARDGVDVVIVHGGDGTVNEVVNGVLGPPGGLVGAPPASGGRWGHPPEGQGDDRGISGGDTGFHSGVPAVGVVPGGSANVVARTLGISADPAAATNQLVDLLDQHRRDGRWRRIGLMDCGECWAVFTAGMGVDGEVVAAVEAQRAKGRKVNSSRYIRTTVPLLVRSARREPTLTLQLAGRDPIAGVHFVFVSNTNPWTYANERPVWTNPGTTYETGLGVFATISMNVWGNLRLVRQMLAKNPRLEAKHLLRDDDVPWVRVTSATPVASQIDGDYVGLRDALTFTAVPNALAVVAPPVTSP